MRRCRTYEELLKQPVIPFDYGELELRVMANLSPRDLRYIAIHTYDLSKARPLPKPARDAKGRFCSTSRWGLGKLSPALMPSDSEK